MKNDLKMMEWFVKSYKLVSSEVFSEKALKYFKYKECPDFIYCKLKYYPEKALSFFKEILIYPWINLPQKYYNFLCNEVEIKEKEIKLDWNNYCELFDCTEEKAKEYISYISEDIEDLEFNLNEYKKIKEIKSIKFEKDEIWINYRWTFKDPSKSITKNISINQKNIRDYIYNFITNK